MVSYIVDNLAMAAVMESFIAAQKFARVLRDKADLTELSLEEACKWAHKVLIAYKVFMEKALDQNVFELLTPEALETLQEVLLVACEYELEVKYPARIVATGGTLMQKAACCDWIMDPEWLGGLMTATSSAVVVSFLQALWEILKC